MEQKIREALEKNQTDFTKRRRRYRICRADRRQCGKSKTSGSLCRPPGRQNDSERHRGKDSEGKLS